MKAGWQTNSLEELCEFRNGLWKGKKPPLVSVGVLRNTNFRPGGVLDVSDTAVLEVEERQFQKRKLKYGDLILEKSGGGPKQPVGRVVFFDRKEGLFSFSNFTSSIRIKEPDRLEAKYLHYVLNWYYSSGITEGMQRHSTGIRNLDFSAYKALEVSYPTADEQRRIVNILDQAFAQIRVAEVNTEENIENARALFESHLNDVFSRRGSGWRERTLSELCEIKHGFAFKSQFFKDSGKYVLLTPGNFYESGGYRDRGSKQKFYCGDIPEGFILKKGALLVAMTEQAAGLLGSPILVPEAERYLHNQRLGLVAPLHGVPWSNEFFFHVFNTSRVRQELHNTASGVKVRHTSPKKIGKVRVWYPNSEQEQRKIARELEDLRPETKRLEVAYQRKHDALGQVRQMLLREAFAGNL